MGDFGWIKLHRELLNKPIWKQSTPVQQSILITLLLMANHDEEELFINGKKTIIKPGQMFTSLPNIAQKANRGVTTQNVRTALARFEKLEFLTNQSTAQGRLITIVNWGVYQGLEDKPNRASNRHLTDHQQTPNRHLTDDLTPNNNIKNVKNDKNDKNEEKDNPPTPLPADWHNRFSPALSSKVDEWLAYKAEKRQSYKPQGLKAFIAKVERMAADYGDDAVAGVISESMAANYQGIVWDWLNKKLPKHPQENFKSQERDLNYLIE